MAEAATFQPGTGAAPATLVELSVACRYVCSVSRQVDNTEVQVEDIHLHFTFDDRKSENSSAWGFVYKIIDTDWLSLDI